MFKLMFWGFIGLMILPSLVETPGGNMVSDDVETSSTMELQESFTTTDAIYMAAGVAGYLKDICAHDEQLCENGARLAQAGFARAKQGIVVLAGMVETHRAKVDAANDPTTTASIE